MYSSFGLNHYGTSWATGRPKNGSETHALTFGDCERVSEKDGKAIGNRGYNGHPYDGESSSLDTSDRQNPGDESAREEADIQSHGGSGSCCNMYMNDTSSPTPISDCGSPRMGSPSMERTNSPVRKLSTIFRDKSIMRGILGNWQRPSRRMGCGLRGIWLGHCLSELKYQDKDREREGIVLMSSAISSGIRDTRRGLG